MYFQIDGGSVASMPPIPMYMPREAIKYQVLEVIWSPFILLLFLLLVLEVVNTNCNACDCAGNTGNPPACSAPPLS